MSLFIFTKIILLLLFYFIYLFFRESYFIISCSGMNRDVPGFIDAQKIGTVENVSDFSTLFFPDMSRA